MRFFLFHNDLRLNDNTTLIQMSKDGLEPIVPIFIFTEQQINQKKNKFYGSNSVQFMCESLISLNKDIKSYNGELYMIKAKDSITALNKIYKIIKITELGWNPNYSPFALKRDKLIKKWCEKKNIKFYEEEDHGLHNILDDSMLKDDGTPFKMFTPFRNYCYKNLKVRTINTFKNFKFKKIPSLQDITFDKLDSLYNENKSLLVHGGRNNGLEKLKLLKNQKDYSKKRDLLTYNTTFLGAYLSFGVLSIREVFWRVREVLGTHTGLESELYWREFYMMIMYHFPKVIGGHFKEQWDGIKYKNNPKYIKAIMNGKTGIPIIDAGIKQLYTTGFSHNRLRMVITSFMAKHCQLDPKWIEKWWANHLVDYNIASTNGGVSWTAGYGTDSMIAQRIFAYWTQSIKFDPKAEFIKHWLPEYKDIEPKHIHNWEEYHTFNKPIFSHKERREEYIKFLKKNKL